MENQINLPESLVSFDKHATIVGITGSGKTYFAGWFVKNKSKLNINSLYITAKSETAEFVENFNFATDDLWEAIEFIVKENGSVYLELDYMAQEDLYKTLSLIEAYSDELIEDEIFKPMTVIVDEISLMVKHKLENSPSTQILGKAASTWRSKNLQLIAMSQRTSHIPATVVTQAEFHIIFNFNNAENNYLTKLYGKDNFNKIKSGVKNQYEFVEIQGNEVIQFSKVV